MFNCLALCYRAQDVARGDSLAGNNLWPEKPSFVQRQRAGGQTTPEEWICAG
jgi:hypothetical protein